MNQNDLNVWIEQQISSFRLNLEDLCGSFEGVSVSIVGRDANEDRFIDDVQPPQFLKIDVAYTVQEVLVTRTVYNGMLPTCNYVINYSQELMFEIELMISGYFKNVGKALVHYWNIPLIEQDLSLSAILDLEEIVLPMRNGMPDDYGRADALAVYRKDSKRTWASSASMLGGYITKYGFTKVTIKDGVSESTVFVLLNSVGRYSSELLNGFTRTDIIVR